MSKTLRGLPTLLVGMLLVSVLFTAYTATQADATHQPANKVGVGGSRVQRMGPGERVSLIQETMKVNNPTDLILQFTAECSILHQLTTAVDETSNVRGSVRIWIEIDGAPVPVTTVPADELAGRVVYCDRMHEQQIVNQGAADDSFSLRDYQLTRTANAFNWVAINAGDTYDDDDDNILNFEVLADFDLTVNGVEASASAICAGGPDSPAPQEAPDCVQAFVGARTLVVEPTKLSNHEQISETDPDGGS